MTLLQAIILAIVEGVTEYLPVSSTGHMVLASTFMGLQNFEFVKNFEVIIQFGAILSVVVLFWRRFLVSKTLAAKVMIAFLPTAAIGFLLRNKVDDLLGSPYVVAVSLLVGGIALIISDRFFPAERQGIAADQLSAKQCLMLGVVQSIAIIPGVSRSAATIIGGMGLGMSRREAAEFSFLLAVPTLGAATLFKCYKMSKSNAEMPENSVELLVVASLIAFVIAMLAIKFFISLLQRYGFSGYGYYRILLGGAMIILLMSGITIG